MTLENVQFSLRELLQNYTASQLPLATAKGLKLIFCYADNMPDRYWGDPVKIEQVLHKFVHNAIKFTAKGEVVIEIHVMEPTPSQPIMLKFTIKDSGIGIEAAKIDNLVTYFHQVDSSSTREYQGTGLGLAIAQKIVTLMQGEVGVTSELGKGSQFWFTMAVDCDEPLQQTDPYACKIHQSPLPQKIKSKTAFALKVKELIHINPTVLLVEDNKTNQLVALGLLKKIGIQADIANHGEEALHKLKQKQYDLVLMDCQMPTMNGYQATQHIRAQEAQNQSQRVPVIAMTANSLDSDKASCLAAGMDDFMSKPIQLETLVSKLYPWLHKE